MDAHPLKFIQGLFLILLIQLWGVWILISAIIFALGFFLWAFRPDAGFLTVIGSSFSTALNIGSVDPSLFAGLGAFYEFALETIYLIVMGIVVAASIRAIEYSYSEE